MGLGGGKRRVAIADLTATARRSSSSTQPVFTALSRPKAVFHALRLCTPSLHLPWFCDCEKPEPQTHGGVPSYCPEVGYSQRPDLVAARRGGGGWQAAPTALHTAKRPAAHIESVGSA